MTEPSASQWVDRPWLLGTQYKTDGNLAARQSIYAYQRPRHDIARLVIDLAALSGREAVADVGCGNGAYLAELTRRGHAGPVLGVDLSPGMLHAARDRIAQATSTPAQATGSTDSPAASAPAAHSPATAAPGSLPVPAVPGLAVADATALPLPAGATDLTMAPHMLYHVPDPAAAVRELRRVTRPGGQVLVVLNGAHHLRELREQVAAALRDTVTRGRERITLDTGAELLARCFDSVVRHGFTAELVVPGPEPVAAYLLSSRAAQHEPDTQHAPDAQRLVAEVLGGLPTDQAGNFRIRTHSGCLVCR
ncbi:MAG TPA: methyltransferase domain-containing protein [Streptosporangiaceae bacterium]|jgi:SAM-dependent methyltransferase